MNDAIRRIVAFTAVAVVVYAAVVLAGMALAPPSFSAGATYAPLGVGLGGLAAYYLVYMDGYEKLRERLG